MRRFFALLTALALCLVTGICLFYGVVLDVHRLGLLLAVVFAATVVSAFSVWTRRRRHAYAASAVGIAVLISGDVWLGTRPGDAIQLFIVATAAALVPLELAEQDTSRV